MGSSMVLLKHCWSHQNPSEAQPSSERVDKADFSKVSDEKTRLAEIDRLIEKITIW